MTQDQRSAARAMMTKGDLGRTPAQQRAEFDGLFAERPLGDDITLTPRTLGGVPALDVQVEGADGDAVIFYLHGGGYVVGSARTGAASRRRSHVVPGFRRCHWTTASRRRTRSRRRSTTRWRRTESCWGPVAGS
ncbi:hypothetical protein ACFQX6_64590 [Streptosporangium lutulentum]